MSLEYFSDRFNGYDDDGAALKETDESGQEKRSSFQRDVDRIKYTTEFRRLKDVTQVARAGESYLYHDRLTHSLKVAQVGRRLAEYILTVEPDCSSLRTALDPDLVEAACLAHDLGHPPFGHLAENELDELLQEKTNPHVDGSEDDPGGRPSVPDSVETSDDYDEHAIITDSEPPGIRFEGNAQTFRILTRLASYRDAATGLGLTVGVLNGVQKYPYGRGEWIPDDVTEYGDDVAEKPGRSDGKFGYYKSETEAFEQIRDGLSEPSVRTVAASVMDYADDVTYAIHDLTDFYKDGRVPLDRLFREAYEGSAEEVTGTAGKLDSANRRELEKLDSTLKYDPEIATPTEVIGSLVTAMFSTTEEELLFEPFEGTPQQRDEIEEFTSFLVEEYLNRVYYEGSTVGELEERGEVKRYIVLEGEDDARELRISETLQQHIDILQQITRFYVIRQPALMGQQRGQRQIIRELFEALYEESGKSDLSWSAIPRPYRTWLEEGRTKAESFESEQTMRARVVADFIASMTELQIVELHKRLTGDSPGSLQNEIIR